MLALLSKTVLTVGWRGHLLTAGGPPSTGIAIKAGKALNASVAVFTGTTVIACGAVYGCDTGNAFTDFKASVD